MAPDPNLWEKYVFDQFAITSSGSRIFEPLTHIFQQTDSFLPIDQLIVLKHRFIHKHAFLMVFSFLTEVFITEVSEAVAQWCFIKKVFL